jgi:antitoxin FitA
MGDSSAELGCYHQSAMKQLIARIDERLHQRLKRRAAAERRSMNALVNDLLDKGLAGTDEQARLDAYLRESGRWYIPPAPRGPVPSRDEVIRMTRGWGTAVSQALEDDRNGR